jgi:formate dehydrogenase major subunit
MTNNWSDIGNSTAVLAWGANPSENHPACMAHINRARDVMGAKLVVVDPRKTRTAVQADKYIRMRPGTDIALINGIVRGIIAEMESRDVADPQRVKFYKFLNETQSDSASAVANKFFSDGSGTLTSKLAFVPGGSKYTDSRFLLKSDGSDYDRTTHAQATGKPVVGGETADAVMSNFPKKADSVYGDTTDHTTTGTLSGANTNTVFNKLKAHVAPYTPTVVSAICGVSETDIAYLVDLFIDNSRCSSAADPTGALGAQDPRVAGYKCLTMLYAMGITQHTCGAQNVKSFAVIQTLMGNMGRAGGGINALRGIHNVQGSTDQGLLYGNIPYYSSNPSTTQTFGAYMDTLWGYPLSGTGGRQFMNGSYDDAYNTGTQFIVTSPATTVMGLQQRGFYNMTHNWFGMPAWAVSGDKTTTDGLYDLWPKGNGDDHITMFRQAAAGVTRAMVVWGQNPAVTEPNQSKVRDGLYNLDTLVVVEMFATETAQCSRKADGVTYLIPACAHVEEAGSVTNSGRVLQWREKATAPKGKSRADLELMFRFAHALNGANAFTHLTAKWAALGKGTLDAYATLYGTRYGWTPTALTNNFESFTDATLVDIWRGAETAPRAQATASGSELMAEKLYREMCTPTTGTSWLYTGAFSTTRTTNKHTNQVDWQTDNRAKSRNTTDWNSTLAYPGWGYSWLVNRRVFYNNGDIPGDVTDFYMGPDSCSRLYVSTNTSTLNYSRWYRTIHRMVDAPDTCLPVVGGMPTAVAPHVLPGRFPAHVEPYETPREDLAATWGRNTKGTAKWDLVKADSNVAATGRSHDPAEFPFVLTTIRCVEHFQGGPITRNNPWNVEAEPEPWVELNSVDAIALGIKDGEYVNLVTARANSLGTLAHDVPAGFKQAGWAKGFKARVGAGTAGNQRVAPGVVAIPWHWGDQGLSKGSRANDLCIDAGDANTVIPESKACLCKIVKIS